MSRRQYVVLAILLSIGLSTLVVLSGLGRQPSRAVAWFLVAWLLALFAFVAVTRRR